MIPQAFVESRLAALSSAPGTMPSGSDLMEKIFSAIMSKKFRKYRVTPKQQEGVKRAIARNIEKNEPIKFAFPFGAYKLWRFEETPEVDWAELFALMYYARWLAPIATLYQPGVEFVFSSDEVIVERMNNITKKETAAYARTLTGLFDFVHRFMPSNFTFSLMPVGSLYTPEEFEADLAERIKEFMAEREGKLPVLSEGDRKMIELNVRLRPGQAEDPQWREKIDVIHNAYYSVKRRRAYMNAPERIAVFTTPIDNYPCIPVGTTKTSIAKFWAGIGALKRKENSFIETVLSPSQLEAARFDWVPMAITGLMGKNFGRLRVLR